MAIQAPVYEPFGSIEVKKDTIYTSTDIPTGMDIVVLTKGVLQWSKIIDENGKNVLKNDEIQYARTTIRGVRMIVKNSTVTYIKPNIPGVWKEFESFKFNTASTYTFLDFSL